MLFLSSAIFFSNIILSKNSFRITIRVANSLDPDQARCFFVPDLGPNSLQRLSADNTSRQRVNIIEPWHGISNNVVCATSKASDQPAYKLSLIRAFASHLNIL